jgi:hypothetical protein
MSDDIPGLTEQHLLLFGTIVQWFARYEVLMQEIMAAVSGADITSIKLLTVSIGFTAKRDALFRLLRHRAVPHDQVDQIQSYFQVIDTFVTLRNDIVHSAWVRGAPQNSIWPLWLTHGPLSAVTPLRDTAVGNTTYSLDDLIEISRNIAVNHANLRAYVVGLGLTPEPVAEG